MNQIKCRAVEELQRNSGEYDKPVKMVFHLTKLGDGMGASIEAF